MIRVLPHLPVVLVLSLASGALHAAPLEATSLYREKATNCRTLDLRNWSHPTRKVMEASRVEIRKVELCNGGVYPVFTVGLPGDPLVGINDAYYNKLNARMAEANGWHSYAFVDSGRGVVVYVDTTGKGALSVNYEEFETPRAK
ncbi:MAG TPA: hypothetical protein PKA55_10940 [Rhodoblastus sp.]|nr:hypothetical protein [Rhodoblastus sp.]